MKIKLISILFILIFSLGANSQALNHEIITEGETPFLLGKINKKGLESENYKPWFTKNFNEYKPNNEIIDIISSKLKNYDLKLFMGTWCGDSKEEVPKLYKVLEATNFPMEQLITIAVSRKAGMYKQSPQHEELGLNIHRVPTLIIYKNGKEVNRIVEHPILSFEEDIKNIITVNTYKSNYQIVTIIDKILKDKGIKSLKRKENKLIKKYKEKVTSMYELNTYGRILFGTGRKEEAIAVFSLNTRLFPNEPRTYMSLANTLGASGYKDKAIKVLEDAIILNSEHKGLKDNLEVVRFN